MRILVTDGMDKGAIEKVRAMGHELVEQFYEPDELGKALRDFDVAIIRSKTKLRAKQIDEAKGSRFKCVIRAGVGLDNIDVQYAKDNGIEVKNTPKSPSESVAELAMAHMFSCARYISIAGHSMREGKWEKKAYGKGIELTGKTLGIVGFGRIGQKLGKMAKAIGMNVIAFDIFHIPGIEEELGIPYVEMDELLAKSDFISVHAPAVDGGALINAERIAKMKDGVRIVNFARGDLVNSKDILEALQNGKVAAYATDFPSDELIGESGVIAIPHLGASTPESEDNCAAMAADELKDYLEEGVIRNSVNMPNVVLPRSADTRICLIHKNVPSMLNQITATLTEKNVNIDNMINKSKKAFAYTVIDTNDAIGDDTLAALSAIEGIVRVRVIR